MTDDGPARLREHLPTLRARLAEAAPLVDAGDRQSVAVLPDLGALGLLDLGVDSIADPFSADADVVGSAELIAGLAEECLSSAFSVWGHRMVLDFVARGERPDLTAALLAGLRSGGIVGSSAMAAGMKAMAGIEPLGITGRVDGDEIVVDGLVRWASNLVPGAVVALPVQLPGDQRIIATVRVGDPGVDVRRVDGLLAMNATASGAISLSEARVPTAAVLSWNLPATARAFRPTFMVLQSAFCVGLARRSRRECEALIARVGNEGLRGGYEATAERVDELEQRWRRLATEVGTAAGPEFVRLRLDASLVAAEATRLEAALVGGAGYVTGSATSRRFREGAFLAVQSPSEAQLRRELA